MTTNPSMRINLIHPHGIATRHGVLFSGPAPGQVEKGTRVEDVTVVLEDHGPLEREMQLDLPYTEWVPVAF